MLYLLSNTKCIDGLKDRGVIASRVNVVSEFAPLKRVVVTQSEFIIPENYANSSDWERGQKLLPEEARAAFTDDISGKDFAEAFPEKQKLWEQERADLIKVLEKYDAEILRPRLLKDTEKNNADGNGASNWFACDPFFTVGNFLIKGSFRNHVRRNEVLTVRDILVNEANNSDAIYVAVPRADVSDGIESQVGPFLEGGDVLVCGKNVFVGNSGCASNEAGCNWLRNLLKGHGYTVTMVPLLDDVLHLDCAMSLVREGLMIVSEDALLDGIPEPLQSWEKIVLDTETIKYLTLNGLPINENAYIADPLFKDSVGAELEKRGITVEYVDFKISRSLGGSFRCSTQPLLRE